MVTPSTKFKLEELTPPGFRNWDLLDQRIIDTLDELRVLHGKPIMCNYPAKGIVHRGYREKGCGVGSKTGFHYKGMAVDLDFSGFTADQARIKIREWKKLGKLEHLGGMEINVSWVHIDVRDPTKFGAKAGTIFEFDPAKKKAK